MHFRYFMDDSGLTLPILHLKLCQNVVYSDEVITTDYISTDAKYYYIDRSNWFWYINHAELGL